MSGKGGLDARYLRMLRLRRDARRADAAEREAIRERYDARRPRDTPRAQMDDDDPDPET